MISGNKAEKSIAERLVTADVDPLRSHLHVGAGGGLEKLLLEMISCGRLTNESSVLKFVDCTLMKVQHAHEDVSSFTLFGVSGLSWTQCGSLTSLLRMFLLKGS